MARLKQNGWIVLLLVLALGMSHSAGALAVSTAQARIGAAVLGTEEHEHQTVTTISEKAARAGRRARRTSLILRRQHPQSALTPNTLAVGGRPDGLIFALPRHLISPRALRAPPCLRSV
jgi:hypothetical protein